MPVIGLDLEKLKYPNNGLYTVCRQLGQRLPRYLQEDERLLYYLPADYNGFDKQSYKALYYKWYHRYAFNPPKTAVWHALHQDSNVFPVRQACKRVLTIHDLNFLLDERKNEQQKKMQLHNLQQLVNETDRVVAISKFTLCTIKEHLQVAAHKCSIVYNGTAIKEFPSFDAPRYRPVVPFLFTIGMLMPKKNFHVLPALLQHNRYELIIAGPPQGDYIKKIQEQAALFGVSNRVKLLGAIDEREKYWYYKNCLAFAFPSLAEGFGIPPLEAMHFGKPVFLSNKTSLPEVGGSLAYFFRDFEPDHMRGVFEEGMTHYEQHRPAAAITAHAQQFSWDRMTKEYLEIYRSLY
jgi:glycosyltransferase involved in cell wall biosynthesis